MFVRPSVCPSVCLSVGLSVRSAGQGRAPLGDKEQGIRNKKQRKNDTGIIQLYKGSWEYAVVFLLWGRKEKEDGKK